MPARRQAPRFAYDLVRREVAFRYDSRAYHPEAVYGAALVMTPRCYAYMESGSPRRVILKAKAPSATEAELEALAGEFHNELLNQTLRWMVAKQNRRTKDAIVAQALFAARSPRKRAK